MEGFRMENIVKLVEDTKTKRFEITETKSGEIVKTSQRNALKSDIINALFNDLKEVYEFVYRGEDGILLEIANDSIADNLKSEEGSGAITACIDIKIKNLDTNAEYEAQAYADLLTEKALKKEEQAKAKKEKIAKDKAERAKRKTKTDEE